MRAMRITEIPSSIDLVRLDVSQQVRNNVDIIIAERPFANTSCFVERHVQEVKILTRNPAATRACNGLASSDQSLGLLNFLAVHLARALVLEEFLNVVFQFDGALQIDVKMTVELRRKLDKSNCVIIEDRNIARCLIGDVDLVTLVDEADQSATHGNDVVVWVG